jgi:hypothetical protein
MCRKEIERTFYLFGIHTEAALVGVADDESKILAVPIQRSLEHAAKPVGWLEREDGSAGLQNHYTVDEMAPLYPDNHERSCACRRYSRHIIRGNVHDTEAAPGTQIIRQFEFIGKDSSLAGIAAQDEHPWMRLSVEAREYSIAQRPEAHALVGILRKIVEEHKFSYESAGKARRLHPKPVFVSEGVRTHRLIRSKRETLVRREGI